MRIQEVMEILLATKYQSISASFIGKVISIPLIIYGIFFVIRVRGLQPAAESGLGEFITALYFIFGASISYFIFILFCLNLLSSSTRRSVWWWFLSCFLLLLAFDEIYMIHENLAGYLEINEIFIFVVYLLMLCVLLFVNWQMLIRISSVFFLVLFFFFSGISVIADTLFGEGLIIVFGTEVGYEQIAETLAALSLSCTFIPVAIQELKYIQDDSIST